MNIYFSGWIKSQISIQINHLNKSGVIFDPVGVANAIKTLFYKPSIPSGFLAIF
jgi:hypothetical protein